MSTTKTRKSKTTKAKKSPRTAVKASAPIAKPAIKASAAATIATPQDAVAKTPPNSVSGTGPKSSVSVISSLPSNSADQPSETVGAGALMMRRKEFIEKVVARSHIKKKDAKPVIEAALAVLGEALKDGRELNLPPFGKIKVNRVKPMARGRVIIAKVRQRDADAPLVLAPLEKDG